MLGDIDSRPGADVTFPAVVAIADKKNHIARHPGAAKLLFRPAYDSYPRRLRSVPLLRLDHHGRLLRAGYA